MTRPILRLWDTCAYVRRFAEPGVDAAIADDLRRRRFLMSSVVAMELYAGTRDVATRRALDRLLAHLGALHRVVTPEVDDFRLVGVALGSYRRRHGAIDPRAHFRDALIAASATRHGAEIVTDNRRDLERWARWLGARPAPRVVVPTAR